MKRVTYQCGVASFDVLGGQVAEKRRICIVSVDGIPYLAKIMRKVQDLHFWVCFKVDEGPSSSRTGSEIDKGYSGLDDPSRRFIEARSATNRTAIRSHASCQYS